MKSRQEGTAQIEGSAILWILFPRQMMRPPRHWLPRPAATSRRGRKSAPVTVFARLDLHADNVLLRFQKQINLEARTGSVEVELACPLNRFHPLEEFADNEGLI